MMAGKRKLIFDGVAGDLYEGEWEVGKEHGAGTAVASDGSSFFGTWVHGKRHGEGVSLCCCCLRSLMLGPNTCSHLLSHQRQGHSMLRS